MKEGVVPYSGIDTDARGALFILKKTRYLDTNCMWCPVLIMKLYIQRPILYMTANNMSDKPVYPDIISNLSHEIPKKIHYMVTAVPGYDDHKLYDLSLKKKFHLVCPVRRYKSTKEERLKLVDFYQSALG